MSYAKILAPLTGGARDDKVLASAFAAAKPFAAHVEALFVRPDPTEAMPFFGEGISGTVVQEIIEAAREVADKAVADARAALKVAADEACVEVLDKPARHETATASWHEVEGNFADQVMQASRLSDLVVFGPLGTTEKPGLSEAFEATLLESGRPVLLTAHVPPKTFASHIAVGWDASVPCARAVTASLPYLKKAQVVEILTVCQGSTPEGVDEVCEYLSLHGVEARQRSVEAGTRPVGEVLLDAAEETNAGCLVLGGYGHTRLRQMLFGGVTRHVVSHANIPLFLVH